MGNVPEQANRTALDELLRAGVRSAVKMDMSRGRCSSVRLKLPMFGAKQLSSLMVWLRV